MLWHQYTTSLTDNKVEPFLVPVLIGIWNPRASVVFFQTVVAHQDRNISGYLNYQIDEKCAEVREIGHLSDNPDVLNALVHHLLQGCEAEQVEEI